MVSLVDFNMSLSGKVGMNYYIDIPDPFMDDTTTVIFTSKGKETKMAAKGLTPVKVEDWESDHVYRFTYFVPIKEIANPVGIRVEKGGEVCPLYGAENGEGSFSVSDFCELFFKAGGLADQYREQLGDLTEELKAKGELCKALENLGHYTQKLLQSDDAVPPLFEGLTEVKKEDLAPYVAQLDGEVKGFSFDGMELVLKSGTDMRIYFSIDLTLPEELLDTMDFLMDGVQLTGDSLGYDGKNLYLILPDIGARDLDKNHELVFTMGGEKTTLQFNALSYAYAVLYHEDKLPAELADVAQALYLYNKAAKITSMEW
jgi:hypothetical protein